MQLSLEEYILTAAAHRFCANTFFAWCEVESRKGDRAAYGKWLNQAQGHRDLADRMEQEIKRAGGVRLLLPRGFN